MYAFDHSGLGVVDALLEVATTSPDLMAPGTSYSVSGWTETTGPLRP